MAIITKILMTGINSFNRGKLVQGIDLGGQYFVCRSFETLAEMQASEDAKIWPLDHWLASEKLQDNHLAYADQPWYQCLDLNFGSVTLPHVHLKAIEPTDVDVTLYPFFYYGEVIDIETTLTTVKLLTKPFDEWPARIPEMVVHDATFGFYKGDVVYGTSSYAVVESGGTLYPFRFGFPTPNQPYLNGFNKDWIS